MGLGRRLCKCILYILTCISFFLLVLASNNECEKDSVSVKDEVYRFLNNIQPLRYQIYLDPCISDGNFSGYVHIDLLLLESTKNLTLHSQDLQFCEEGVYLTLKGGLNETFEALKPVKHTEDDASSSQDSDEVFEDSYETVRPIAFVYHKIAQTVTMKFNDYLKPGRYSLEINYMGAINSDSSGVFRKYYKDLNENRVMLLSNLFPSSARRVFPCRDEPGIKAEMYFTMQTSLNFTTILAKTSENYVEYKEGQRWTHLHPVSNTSTHQLNFAVLNNIKNMTKLHANKTYIVYSTTPDIKMAKLTLDTYEKAMTLMENLTKINYPLDTFINLVIPEKIETIPSASLGFITTKKSYTLYNERFGPQKKKDVLLRASRDVASQWFNQIISPASWKYVWLNEGLTEYMKYYLADKIMPNWRLKDIFVVWELQRRSFIPNKITDGIPLNTNIPDNPKNIECLLTRSISSTSKGASLIKMMSHFLSEDVLHSGINELLKTKRYNSTKPDDFWETVQNAVNASKDFRLHGLNISELMETWINSEFYPIVKVTRNYTSGSIKVTQIPAITFFNLTENNVTDKWWIPINYATQSKPYFNVTFPSHWLTPDVDELDINDVAMKDWVIFNIQQTGYYRVLYDEENWRRLVYYLNSENYHKISAVNRAQIINDAVQFALKRHLDMGIFLDLISYLQRETDYIPWYDAQFILSFLNYHLSNTNAYDDFKNFSLLLIKPLVDKIGYEDRPNDDFSTLLLRRISNHWACHFGYEKCWNNATKQLETYLDDKKSELGSVDLQDWARCFGLNGANETIWNRMFKKYQENLSEDALIYLACSENTTILNNFLNTSISNYSVIPDKQLLSVFKSVCLYPSGDDKRINLCLNFIECKFDDITKRFGNATESFTYFLDLLASEIRQRSQLEQFQQIIAQKKAAFASRKLGARVKQTENRVSVFEQKANYYKPFLKEKIIQLQI